MSMKELIKHIKIIVFIMGMLLLAVIPNSCVQDSDIAMTEPERISLLISSPMQIFLKHSGM